MARLYAWPSALALALIACACGNAHDPKPQPRLIVPDAGIDVTPDASDAATETDAGVDADVDSGAGGSQSQDAATSDAGAAGATGEHGVQLPPECPGMLEDYTSVLMGSDSGDTFDEMALEGRVLVFGGSGDDTFFASPPGAGDCLIGAAGNDRFETSYQSAPSVFVGGEGDDSFVLRGSADTDTAYIADFNAQGRDRIVLDAMTYGLTFVEGPPLATEVVSVHGFEGGNSTADDTARILYNPDDGGLWYDSDANGSVATAVEIAVIQNFAHYDFDLQDFALE